MSKFDDLFKKIIEEATYSFNQDIDTDDLNVSIHDKKMDEPKKNTSGYTLKVYETYDGNGHNVLDPMNSVYISQESYGKANPTFNSVDEIMDWFEGLRVIKKGKNKKIQPTEEQLMPSEVKIVSANKYEDLNGISFDCYPEDLDEDTPDTGNRFIGLGSALETAVDTVLNDHTASSSHSRGHREIKLPYLIVRFNPGDIRFLIAIFEN